MITQWFLVKIRDGLPPQRRDTIMLAVRSTFRQHVECVLAAEMMGAVAGELRMPQKTYACSAACQDEHARCVRCTSLVGPDHPHKGLWPGGVCQSCYVEERTCRKCGAQRVYRLPQRLCASCRA